MLAGINQLADCREEVGLLQAGSGEVGPSARLALEQR